MKAVQGPLASGNGAVAVSENKLRELKGSRRSAGMRPLSYARYRSFVSLRFIDENNKRIRVVTRKEVFVPLSIVAIGKGRDTFFVSHNKMIFKSRKEE